MISVSRATSVLSINTRTYCSVGSVDYAFVSDAEGTGSGCLLCRDAVSFPSRALYVSARRFLLVPSSLQRLTCVLETKRIEDHINQGTKSCDGFQARRWW